MAKHYPAWEMTRIVLQWKRGESKHRLLSCFSLCLVAFLLHYAWRRGRVEGRGRPRCSPTNWSCSTSVYQGRAPSQLKIISHEICGMADWRLQPLGKGSWNCFSSASLRWRSSLLIYSQLNWETHWCLQMAQKNNEWSIISMNICRNTSLL